MLQIFHQGSLKVIGVAVAGMLYLDAQTPYLKIPKTVTEDTEKSHWD